MAAAQRVRSAGEVAERLLLVASVCAVASDESLRERVVPWLKREAIWSAASPAEKKFLEATESTEKELIQQSWRAEAVYVLGWALGLVSNLQPPTDQASTGGILDQIPAPGDSVESFLSRATLRSAAELHSAAEDLFNANSWCRAAKASNRPERHGYDIEVADERHRAANWLVCYENAEWDNVPTDT
jgi:hypothetical protein